MSKAFLSVGLAVMVLVPGAGQAFPFFSTPEPPKEAPQEEKGPAKRYHLLISDKPAERDLLQLFATKKTISDELRALHLLIEEKKREAQKFDQDLAEAFSIKPDRNYRYEPVTRTIYEQISKPRAVTTNAVAPAADAGSTKDATRGSAASGEVDVEQKIHLQLKTPEEAHQFASLAAGKRLSVEEFQVFGRVVKEKQVELDRVDGMLKNRFAISRDRNYWYDNKTMRLYELVDTPKQGTLPPYDTP